MKKLDKRIYGIIAGLIFPALIIVAFYLSSDTIQVDFKTFLLNGWEYRLFSAILPPALLLNLVLFSLFMLRNRMRFCQGVVIATALYGVLILIMRLW
jgi:hypothetical protein